MFLKLLLSGLFSDQKPVINQGNCLALRFNKDDCNRCQKYCPLEVIDIQEEIVVGDSCNGCYICNAVCPTKVFSVPKTGLNELLLQVEKGRIYFSCIDDQTDKVGLDSCLAGIDTNLLISLVLLATDNNIYLNCTECAGCEVHFFLIEEAVENANRFLKKLPVEREIKLITKKDEWSKLDKEVKYSRKEFFKRLQGKGSLFVSNLLDNLFTDMEESEKGLSSFDLLKRVLQKSLSNLEIEVASDDKALFTSREISDGCTGCGKCTSFCINGALTEHYFETNYEIQFQLEKCLNCGTCLEVCPENALQLDNKFILKDLVNNQIQVLWSHKLITCSRCGKKFLSLTEQEECSVCLKRDKLW